MARQENILLIAQLLERSVFSESGCTFKGKTHITSKTQNGHGAQTLFDIRLSVHVIQ